MKHLCLMMTTLTLAGLSAYAESTLFGIMAAVGFFAFLLELNNE